MLERRTHLGWAQLVHRKGRFAMAIAGVAFAGLLVFMQLGFLNMLLDASVTIHEKLNADIVLLSRDGQDMVDTGSFPRRHLIRTLGIDGVADAEALYVRTMEWLRPDDTEGSNVLILAARPDVPVFDDPDVVRASPTLKVPGTVLFDTGARGDYGAFIDAVADGRRPRTEVNGTEVTVDGLFRFGSSFAIEGIMITSAETLAVLDPNHHPGAVSVGLIRVAEGHDPEEVRAAIDAMAGMDETVARTLPEFVAFSRSELERESPIAVVFSFGAVIGLLVGTVIVVQILSTDVQDHLAEYATFKAMGFADRYLLGVVYEQSAILTVFGFVPGFAASMLLYEVLSGAVAMPMAMTVERVLLVLGLTALMCAASGTLAMRRVADADPADVF